MTTIPNLNIVVQQGAAARDAHNIRQQPVDAAQSAVAHQPDKEEQQRTTVHETEEGEHARFSKDGSGRRQPAENRPLNPKKKKKEDEKPEGDTGHILDTVV